MSRLARERDEWREATNVKERKRLALVRGIRREVERGRSQQDVADELGWPRQRVHDALK